MICHDGSTTPNMSDSDDGLSSGTVTPSRDVAVRPIFRAGDAGTSSPSGIRWKIANQGKT